MTAIPGSVRVAGFIAPTDSTDTYAVHDDAYGRGGWRTVANITERNSISADRRKVGMAVRVLDSGGFQKFYTLSGGIDNANWIEDSFGGGGGGSIDIDITYYVDGDAGSDSYSGLSWMAAKKTFAFLYSGDEDAIPRGINATVTITCKGTILSKTADRHTVLDNFYGSGSIVIAGEFTDVITGQTLTGWDDTTTSVECHSYVESSGAAWVVDDYQGCFIQFTTPASDILYPIISNTAIRIETIALPDLVGTEVFKIVRPLTSFKAATVSAPNTIIDIYPDYSIFKTENFSILLSVSGIRIINKPGEESGGYNFVNFYVNKIRSSYSSLTSKVFNSIISWLSIGGLCDVYSCLFGEQFYSGSQNSIFVGDPTSTIFITRCIFCGCSTTDYWGLLIWDPTITITGVRVNNYYYGIYLKNTNTGPLSDVLIENCNTGVLLQNTQIDSWAGIIRFKNNTTAIRFISDASLYIGQVIGNEAKLIGSGNINDIVLADDPSLVKYTFSDIENQVSISNVKTNCGIIYYKDDSYYSYKVPVEYNNSTSGLDAYNYQEAIDILASKSIESDIIYYVDGDNGSDAYTGLSWATAKKTMAFLYSGDGYAIPRELNAVVTVRTRGTILSKTIDRHTVIDGLYGSGHLKILGETQDVVTGLVPTGWDNTASSVTYKSYLDVGTATWTVDEYQGMFIQFTSPASTDLFPIMSNTATRLETIGLPGLAGTETFKIINNLTIIKAASVSDPSLIIEAYPFEFFKIESIVSEVCNIDCSTLMGATYGNSIKLYSMVNSPGYDAILAGYKPKAKGCILNNVYLENDTFIFDSCLIKGGNPYVSIVSGIGRFDFIQCGFYGISALELPAILAYTPGFVNISSVRIKNYDVGVYAEHGTTLSVFNVLIEGCNIGLNLNKTVVDAYSQFVRFKNNVVCINLSGTTFKVDSPTSGFLGSGNTYDIVVGNKPYISSYNFSDVVARNKIYNVKSGGQIIYYEVGSDIKEETFVEYDNTTSLLDAYNYQDAIDLLAVSTGSGAVKTIFSDLAIPLTDAYNFILTESIAATDEAIVYLFESTPTVGVGFIIISFYKDAARTQKVHEISIDLADAVSWNSSEAFGIQTDTTGTIYGKINCSELSPGSTINISLYANSISPTITPIPMPGPYGDGLEDNGFGDPQIALAPNSGLEFLSGELKIKSDVTTPATVSIGVGGTSVTGVVNLTTDQTIAGQKLFDSCGLIPTDSYGPPTGGGWINGVEALDGYGVKWRYFQNSWELADVVTEYPEIIAGTTLAYGGIELFKIPVTGDVGQCLWLRVWARRATGTAEIQIPFRVRIFETSDARGREMVWQGLGLARQTYLDVSLPASQTYIEVNSNDIIDVDELICIYENDSRFEIGRCSARPTGQITLSESLVDGNTWDVNTLAIPVTEWWNVPWINRDGDSSDQKHILLQVRHDGLSTDPSLVFYVQVLAQSRGIIR